MAKFCTKYNQLCPETAVRLLKITTVSVYNIFMYLEQAISARDEKPDKFLPMLSAFRNHNFSGF